MRGVLGAVALVATGVWGVVKLGEGDWLIGGAFVVCAVLGLAVAGVNRSADAPRVTMQPSTVTRQAATEVVTNGLEVVALGKRFGDVVALDGCSFAVRPGRVLGLLGPNGAGKTTAMRCIFGLVRPDVGEVRWGGAPIDREARLRFGYMPEERGLYPAHADPRPTRVPGAALGAGSRVRCGRRRALADAARAPGPRRGAARRALARQPATGAARRRARPRSRGDRPRRAVRGPRSDRRRGALGGDRRARRARARRWCSPAISSTSSSTSARTSS